MTVEVAVLDFLEQLPRNGEAVAHRGNRNVFWVEHPASCSGTESQCCRTIDHLRVGGQAFCRREAEVRSFRSGAMDRRAKHGVIVAHAARAGFGAKEEGGGRSKLYGGGGRVFGRLQHLAQDIRQDAAVAIVDNFLRCVGAGDGGEGFSFPAREFRFDRDEFFRR
jgi:hypothetical protein